MYWTGRYFERAHALARAILAYERMSLDSPTCEAFDLEPLLALVGRERAPGAKPLRAELVRSLVLDEQNPSSVRGALGVARENLRSGRTLMPAAVWMPVNQLYARLGELSAEDTAPVFAVLEEVAAAAREVEGELTASMTRDAAYAFWCVGCRTERADMLLRVLMVLAPGVTRARDQSFADVRALGLLECLGADGMFRRRHQARADVSAILDFVLTDDRFPRSLRQLVTNIERELDALPRPGGAHAALAACYPPAPHELDFTQASALASVERLLTRLEDFGEVMAETYFPAENRLARARPPAALASLPPARDPFESLGRDHAAVEAVLCLVDELTARAECGADIDHSAVRAIVDFFTDFGVLGHHEKEEAILMPALLRAGFDWQDGPLATMRRDHRQEHYFLRVLTQLSVQRGDWSEEARRQFISLGREFTQFLRAHMRLEQREVFAPSEAKLSPEVKANLTQELRLFDAVNSGGVRTALDRLDCLLTKYGVALGAG
jgi:uncharacterized alpha-E superfamily protein/hemerythrin-like domain-containing protein